MGSDPWSRPTVNDLKQILESIGRSEEDHQREVERLELAVPAEIVTQRGNTVAAMTREISRNGVGLIHRGAITAGDVTLKMASETRVYEYRVKIEWCLPCNHGMFLSGGRFLGRLDQSDESPTPPTTEPSDN
ncbi:MAG: PilZ domain-containing protein [Planctomycetaceae bacterium]